MISSREILILKWKVAYNICMHFDKGLNTVYAEPKIKAINVPSFFRLLAELVYLVWDVSQVTLQNGAG